MRDTGPQTRYSFAELGENRQNCVRENELPCSNGRYRIVRLLPRDPMVRKMLPEVYARAVRFIETYQCGTNPIWLGQLLFSHFYQNSNLVHVLVVLDDEDKIIAHAISYVDHHEALGNYVQILHAEKDVPDGRDMMETGFSLIDDWTRSLGLQVQLNIVKDAPHERLYRKLGFSHWRTILERRLPNKPEVQ